MSAGGALSSKRTCRQRAPGVAKMSPTWSFFLQWWHGGRVLSPVLSVPGTTTSMIQLDWFHVVGLGVGQDLCGDIFWLCVRRKAGGVFNVDARLDTLSSMLKAYNKEARPPNPINKLTMAW